MSTWILLRGLMREQRHWGDFPRLFGQALPGAVVVTPDLPGNGRRHAQRSATTVAAMVEGCRRDLRERGLQPPYALLALSLGGMVAVEWAARHPDEIARCVLVNTSMRPYGGFYARLRWQNYPAIVKLVALGGVARQERLILRLTSNRLGGDGGENGEGDSDGGDGGRPVSSTAGPTPLLERWIAWQREYPVTRANALRQLWSAARFRAPASRPAVPVLILAGAGDRLVDHGCSLRLARAWDARCLLHPDAGHDLPLDDGPWVARSVARWLAGGGA